MYVCLQLGYRGGEGQMLVEVAHAADVSWLALRVLAPLRAFYVGVASQV